MADHSHDHHAISPEMTARHKAGWNNFMRAATYGVVIVAAILILMDIFLV